MLECVPLEDEHVASCFWDGFLELIASTAILAAFIGPPGDIAGLCGEAGLGWPKLALIALKAPALVDDAPFHLSAVLPGPPQRYIN